ncbi:60S ribosomal protein L27 [Phyllosticta capitalensis]
MKFLKVGRVAIITRGRFAGKKVVIIQPQDSGSKSHPFPHALVAGIERYPSKVTRRMSKKKQTKRSTVKPFIKTVNYNHLMPTRYTLELEGLKGAVSNDTFKEVSQREDAKKNVKKALEERYQSGKNRWFFTALFLSGSFLSEMWHCGGVRLQFRSGDTKRDVAGFEQKFKSTNIP